MADAEQSAPLHASSGSARISFAAAGLGVLLLVVGIVLIERAGADWTVAQLVFWSVVLAWTAMAVGAVSGVRAVRRADGQPRARVVGICAAALNITFLLLLSPIFLWNLLFFVCDCVSP